jgi:biotin carboxylase
VKHRILFVAAGLAQAPAIREARAAGYTVAAMDGSADAPGLQEAEKSYAANILDAAEIVRCARDFEAHGIVSVCCDVAMEAVALAVRELGLPGIPLEVVQVSRSKIEQRQRMQQAGLLVPQYWLVRSAAVARAAWDGLTTSACVIKPVDASGSRGVSYVDSPERVDAAFTLAVQNSKSGTVLVESFMPGIEYSVEAWVTGTDIHLLATSVKVRTQPPYLLDRQVHFPDDLLPEQRQTMIDHAFRAIAACGFRDCPVHLECIWSPQGPMVVELAARGAGFKVFTEMLPRVTGLSTALASVQTSLGEVPNLRRTAAGLAASLVFVDPVPGVFVNAEGVDAARALPGISEIVLYPQAGQALHELRSGADRAGHIIAYDPDPARCRATALKALEMIRLVTRP